LIGIKGSKSIALDIKKKVEIFLKSSLHLKLLNENMCLINIHSDNLYCFNVIISSKNKNQLLFNSLRNKIIQQKKKGIKIRKMKTLKSNITSLKKKNPYTLSPLSSFYINKNNIQNSNLGNSSNEKKDLLFVKSSINIMYSIKINADLIKIKRLLFNTGLINKNNRPIAIRKFLNLDSYYIIQFYKRISLLI
jgi:hypothetical protein